MKKILIFIGWILHFTTYGQSAFIDIGCGEYATAGLKNNGEVWTYSQVNPLATLQKYGNGVDSIVFLRGGQYHTQAWDSSGRTYRLGNQHTNVVLTPVDIFDQDFKDNFYVEPMYGANFSIRGLDSSIWYWGVGDPMNYSATEPIVKPFPITMPAGKHFKKLLTGTNTGFNDGITFMIGLASDGSLWKWDKKTGSAGLTTPTNVTPAGETVIDFGVVSFYGYLAITASNKVMARGVSDGRYVGQASHSTSWVDRTAAWGVTFPTKEVCAGTWTVHIVDANNNLFACGSNHMGNIGNGFLPPLLKSYVAPGDNPANVKPWQINIAVNGQNMQAPVQIPGKFKNVRSSTSITFYHYAQDLGGNWYVWGRNKSFALSNGISLPPYTISGFTGNYAIYPNALDIPMPKRVEAFVTPYSFRSFTVEEDQPPVVGAGINQYITTTSSTLYGVVHQQEFTITSTTWSKISGPSGGAITSPNNLTTNITGLNPGTYVFRLSATNSVGLSSTNDVSVIVTSSNISPTVTAGGDQILTLPTNTTTVLTVSATDPDGSIASYAWTKISGPTGGAITNPSSASTTITGLTAGTYVYRITVTDNGGANAFDEVIITVNPEPVLPPNTIRTLDKWVTFASPVELRNDTFFFKVANTTQDGIISKEFMASYEQMKTRVSQLEINLRSLSTVLDINGIKQRAQLEILINALEALKKL